MTGTEREENRISNMETKNLFNSGMKLHWEVGFFHVYEL